MRRCRLFCPDLSEGSILLPPEESHHAISSLRAKPGHEVVLFDGAGREASGRITRISRRQVHVEVDQITHHPFELLHRITLAVAMTRAHRQGYLIEKCTELGVAAIWPIIADRSISRPNAGARLNAVAGARFKSRASESRTSGSGSEKWSRRAIEAAKQSGRSWVPTIAAPRKFLECIDRIGDFDASSLTHTDPSLTPFGVFLAALVRDSTLVRDSNLAPATTDVLVWVGPEGGWSDAERDRALEAGAVPTTLGPTVLRTETAAVAVCAAAAMCATGQSAGNAAGPIP